VKSIKQFAEKHMGTKDIRIDPGLNKEIWRMGVKHVPTRMRLRIARKRNDEEGAKEKLYCLVSHVPGATVKGLQTTVVEEASEE
jgi:large subunit ribosomal protein L31e